MRQRTFQASCHSHGSPFACLELDDSVAGERSSSAAALHVVRCGAWLAGCVKSDRYCPGFDRPVASPRRSSQTSRTGPSHGRFRLNRDFRPNLVQVGVEWTACVTQAQIGSVEQERPIFLTRFKMNHSTKLEAVPDIGKIGLYRCWDAPNPNVAVYSSQPHIRREQA